MSSFRCCAMLPLLLLAWFLWLHGAAIDHPAKSKQNATLKQRQTLSTKETNEKQNEKYKTRLDQDMTLIFPGDNPTATSAEIQKRLKEFADQNSVKIIQTRSPQDRKVQYAAIKQAILTKVSPRIEINCDLEEFVKFLLQIENSLPYLEVEDLTVYGYRGFQTSPESWSGLPDRGGMPDPGSTPVVGTDNRASKTIVGYISSAEKMPAARPEPKRYDLLDYMVIPEYSIFLGPQTSGSLVVTKIRADMTVVGYTNLKASEVPTVGATLLQAKGLKARITSVEAILFKRDMNLELLKELTEILPVDTILSNYANRDGAIQLIGMTVSSSDLIQRLEKSRFLKDVRIQGIVFNDKPTSKYPFTIIATLKR
jgi:hypothetical protein